MDSDELKGDILQEKSFAFAVRIVRLAKYLRDKKRENILSDQIVGSGTAIGRIVRESQAIPNLRLALEAANETMYWLLLLKESSIISQTEFDSIEPDIEELLNLLTSSLNQDEEAKEED